MPQIHCLPDDQILEIGGKETLLLAAIYYGVPHTAICGGHARCSTCRVRIVEGLQACAPRTEAECQLAQKLGFPDDIRLACQLKVQGDVTVRRLVVDELEIDMVESQLRSQAIGKETSLAIMFTDIRQFTARSESMLPYDVIYLLNAYFDRVGKVIVRHGGVINTYMGDGFMALFGADNALTATPEQMAQQAVQAALDILTEVDNLNRHLEVLRGNPLRVGIGLHFGQVVLGKIGAKQNQVVTAIGDAVNFASRIESATKITNTQLLVSESLWQLVHDRAILASQHLVAISGKQGKFNLYEIQDITPAPYPLVKPQTWFQKIWTICQKPVNLL